MSSAANHRKRSHRSEMSNRASFGNMDRKTMYKQYEGNRVKASRMRLAEFFSRMKKNKESKGDVPA